MNTRRQAGTGDSDDALEQRWRAGDPTAANQLFDRYRRRLHGFFMRNAREQADDLVQQTIAAALWSHRRLDRSVPFGAYLFGTARFQLTGHIRQRRKDALRHILMEVEELSSLPARPTERSNDAALLLAALAGIQQEFRAVVTMAYLEERSAPEIALAMNLPVATVYSRLRRGKQKLRAAYASMAGE